jgi:hypothetical protein
MRDLGTEFMNAPSEMTHEDVLRVKLEVLRREHRDLDDAIMALQEAVNPDQLTLRRLKKQKLSLKDRIAAIEDELTPTSSRDAKALAGRAVQVAPVLKAQRRVIPQPFRVRRADGRVDPRKTRGLRRAQAFGEQGPADTLSGRRSRDIRPDDPPTLRQVVGVAGHGAFERLETDD